MAKTKVVICPYCGASQPAEDQCRSCGGLYDELSRQATHNDMGPWYIRMSNRPHQPGCSYETLIRLIERGQLDKYTILRGPTTKQYWTVARRVPGISHLMGYCHSCDVKVNAEDHGCPTCGVPFGAYLDRNHLGLPEVRPLPWEAGYEEKVALASAATSNAGVKSSAAWAGGGDSRGISSFASDAEMVGNGSVAPTPSAYVPPVPGVPGVPGGADTETSVYEQASTTTLPQTNERATANDSQANRSLRREVNRQQRLINVLAVLIVIAFILVIVTNLGRLSESPQDETKASGAIPETTNDDSTDSQASNGIEPVQASPPPATESIDPSVEDTLQEPLVQPVVRDVETLFQQAQADIKAGTDEDRSFEDRIASYEKALENLKQISDEPASANLPANLAEVIKQCERELEKLRLRLYYP
ncbi:MAG: hypothetical protein O7G85_15170 [Planctomycetota bacterium]|nr:hypothetical protein [Planctomycetota bacterium]